MNTNTSTMQHQNWEYTTFVSAKGYSQKNGKSNAHSGTEALDAKMIKKAVAPNKQKTGTNIKQVIESEEMKVDTVSHDFRVALQRARQEKKMTQADLAQKVMEKQSVISEYESGKAIPNTTVISKLERVLGIRLPKQKKN